MSEQLSDIQKVMRINRHAVAAIEATARIGNIEVSRVRSIHGKRDLVSQIHAALESDCKIYVNERTGTLLKNKQNLEHPLVSAVQERLSDIYCTRFPEAARDLGLIRAELQSALADAIGEAAAHNVSTSTSTHEFRRDER